MLPRSCIIVTLFKSLNLIGFAQLLNLVGSGAVCFLSWSLFCESNNNMSIQVARDIAAAVGGSDKTIWLPNRCCWTYLSKFRYPRYPIYSPSLIKTPVRDASTRQMPPFILNKAVLITASSAGLGAATARAFAAGGATVVISYCSNAQKADTLIRELSRQYDNVAEKEDGGSSGKIQSPAPQPRHVAIRADLSRRFEIIRLVEETVAVMGRIDVVVSNQGWTRTRDFNNLDENVDDGYEGSYC